MKNVNRETLRLFWQTAKVYKVYSIGLFIMLPLAILFHQILPPIIAARVLDTLAAGEFTRDTLWETFGADLLLYAGLLVFGGTVVWRVAIYFVWKLDMYVARDLRRMMFNHLMSLDAEFHADSFGGSLVSRSNKLIGAYYNIRDTFVFQFYTLFIVFIFSSVVLWNRAPIFVVTLFFFTIFFITLTIMITKAIRKLNTEWARKDNKVTGYLADMVTNVMAVKSFSHSEYERERFDDATEDLRRTSNKVMRATLIREIYFGGATTGIQVLALVIATVSVVIFDAEIGLVLLVLTYTNNLTVRLWDFALSGLKNLNRGFGDAEEATRTIHTQPKITDTTTGATIPNTDQIAFQGMHFSHADEKLFADFNLTINKGEKLGLVGHSGSGKTSLTSLLLRFKDIDDGAITIGGIDIRDVSQDELREHISYVPQEPLLFHRSLSENISYGKTEASDNEIKRAARQANAHEFIKDLPDGYNTLVGERGVKLSGGQRQRVAIARAMLKDAPILVLDEATSALDSESEQLIQEALWKLMEGKTAIVIAHRLSTIQKMDRIVVLDNGRIIEEGSHKNLLKKKGQYAKLWSHQSGGFLQE